MRYVSSPFTKTDLGTDDKSMYNGSIKYLLFFKTNIFCSKKYFTFFFFNDIDERRRYTKKVHPLKARVGPSIMKRGNRGDLWAGLKVSVDVGLKQLVTSFKVVVSNLKLVADHTVDP